MTNGERFNTAKERAEAFYAFCEKHDCFGEYPLKECPLKCRLDDLPSITCCLAYWLDLEAPAEEPLPCPFCGSDVCCVQTDPSNNNQLVWCENCGYNTGSNFTSEHAAIAEHNRVARAAKEKEANDANA